ncbi:hypothetical protein Q5752_001588 [Cryptotrichosporon argae]
MSRAEALPEPALARHYSDPAHAPARPSHLAPGPRGARASLVRPRGTVSMPTSPLGRVAETLWDEVPQSAHAFFGVSNPHPSAFGFPPYPPSPLLPVAPHQLHPPASAPGSAATGFDEPDSAGEHEHDAHGQAGQGVPAPRKKRAQVRIACVHCQKACKKCSNTRPCERCVKYGFKDCIDSSRKPRRTGMKRGPYKRRLSRYGDAYAGFEDGDHPPESPYGVFPSLPASADHQPFLHTTPDQPQLALALHGALVGLNGAGGLAGPRWVEGRRVAAPPPPPALGAYVPGPVEPNFGPPGPAAFPLSLATGAADPFSRAVSPVHIRPALGDGAPGSGYGVRPPGLHVNTALAGAFEPGPAGSGPKTAAGAAAGAGYDLHSPALVALRRIRKPSLRTLMSASGASSASASLAPSPVASQSPTLYDRAPDDMDLDDGAWDQPVPAPDEGQRSQAEGAEMHEPATAGINVDMQMEVDALGLMGFEGPYGH